MTKALDKSLNISYWREEFTKEKDRLGKRWRKLLAGNFPEEYNTLHAAGMLSNVNMHRASLKLTAQVVMDMRKLDKSDKKQQASPDDTTRQQAIEASVKNLERPSTRIFAQAKARQAQIKSDYEKRIDGHRKKKVNQ